MTLATRAYSAFEVKAMDAKARTFKGWATTPAVDRIGDTINPLGAKFTNPLPLLWQHKHDLPVGTVEFDTPTKKGISFTASMPVIEEPGPLRDRVDTAWGEIKYGLVKSVSIGFKPIKYAFRDDGGVDYQETGIYELSLVSIPALPEAVITSVKSMEPLTAAMVKFLKDADDLGIPLVSARATSLRAGAVALRRR